MGMMDQLGALFFPPFGMMLGQLPAERFAAFSGGDWGYPCICKYSGIYCGHLSALWV